MHFFFKLNHSAKVVDSNSAAVRDVRLGNTHRRRNSLEQGGLREELSPLQEIQFGLQPPSFSVWSDVLYSGSFSFFFPDGQVVK